MASVSNLCKSCLLLENGVSLFYGDTNNAITKYLYSSSEKQYNEQFNLNLYRPSWAKSLITSVRILNSNYQEQSHFPLGSDIIFEMTFLAEDKTSIKSPVMGLVINHATFGIVAGVNTRMTGYRTKPDSYTSATMRCILKRVPFLQGKYTVDIWLSDHTIDLDTLTGCLSFTIKETDIYNSGHPPSSNLGIIFLDAEWEVV
jgi:lipopolysaccharide transport system ATP-binding protein